MQLPPMSEADRLLFHAETLLEFVSNFAALQQKVLALVQEAIHDSDDAPFSLPDTQVDVQKLVGELRKALLALHSVAK